MKLIAITVPYFFCGEAAQITALLASGKYDRVHIRKPDASLEDMRTLLENIPEAYHSRISLHDCHALVREYAVGGVHLNRRNNVVPEGWSGIVSRSIHSIDEIGLVTEDYAFLSPVYESISKPGYIGRFDLNDLRGRLNDRIYALGGVTKDRLPQLEEVGFGGAAMLGAIWHHRLDMAAFRFQFITHPSYRWDVVRGARCAIDGGARWIQLRHKEADRETLLDEGEAIRYMCRQVNATFIIDDYVDLVEVLDADGVHLGKNDMPVAEARKILGPGKIIGATANCFDDIKAAVSAGADYIGLGPFRFTTTKKNLSPVLGLDGYRSITEKCRHNGIRVPIVAIGGIGDSDVGDILSAGVSGIALSSSILNAPDPVMQTMITINEVFK